VAVAEPMIAALLRPEAYDHPTSAITLLETHISWVLLTGPWAYKIRKPVNLGFVDFSTVALRRHFSEEELRLNRRLAPDLYRDLVTIHGPAERASLHGDGPPLDTAVRMRQFPQEALLASCLPRLAAGPEGAAPLFATLAADLAAFHAAAARVPA
jgi:aminoglycoside phosphotransferase family enzyme